MRRRNATIFSEPSLKCGQELDGSSSASCMVPGSFVCFFQITSLNSQLNAAGRPVESCTAANDCASLLYIFPFAKVKRNKPGRRASLPSSYEEG